MSEQRYTLGATGLKFSIGDSIRPKGTDVIGALLFLEKHDMARFLWPTQQIRVKGMNAAEIHSTVPECLANAILVKYKLDDPLKAALWIVAWYNHMWLGGVRPSTASRAPRVYSLPKVWFKCPMCGDHYYPPNRMVNQDAAIRAFSKWLVTHAKVSYHKNKITTRLPRRFDPDPKKGTGYIANKKEFARRHRERMKRNREPSVEALLAQFPTQKKKKRAQTRKGKKK